MGRQINFRADDTTVGRLNDLCQAWQCSAGEAIERALYEAQSGFRGGLRAYERYDTLCRSQYRELRRLLSEADLIVIANATRNWWITPESVRGGVALEVSDYLELDPDEVAQLPPVDGRALVAKLSALTDVQEHALLWALDDARRRADAGEPVPWSTVLGGQLRGPSSN